MSLFHFRFLWFCDVTIAALPEHGPCYLVVGPYKMVVTSPGTYSFPLEVFETYRAYTCPTRVPLTFEYDDGYDYGNEPEPLCSGPQMMASAPRTPQEELEYELQQIPPCVLRPSRIELSQIGNTPIEILCNMAGDDLIDVIVSNRVDEAGSTTNAPPPDASSGND